MKLTDEEVRKRLIRLRNLERLYPIARAKITALTLEVKALKITVAAQQKTIEDLKLQMEELRAIVFRNKKPPRGNAAEAVLFSSQEEKLPRTPDSYQRPIPEEKEVTQIKPHSISQCACGTTTTKKRVRVFYEEDIPIPIAKVVVRHEVEQIWCPRCQRWQSAIDLPPATVILGPHVQKYVCYLSVMCRLSFTQIQNVLNDMYRLKVSQGEITKILERQSGRLQPAYEQLLERIRSEPVVHLDETSWNILTDVDRSYSWVMSGTRSGESIFLIGENRGKGHANDLIGEDYDGVVVTDDYGAYRKLKNHQLCWAHVLRKFRDLANSQELDERQIAYCLATYRRLCNIYCLIRDNRTTEKYDEFSGQLEKFSTITFKDHYKMIRLKTTLRKNILNYLTCLQDAQIPMTNNQAERSLRHLVLKRKISFGSFTKKTANNLAILLSVLMSLRQRFQGDWFTEYLRA